MLTSSFDIFFFLRRLDLNLESSNETVRYKLKKAKKAEKNKRCAID